MTCVCNGAWKDWVLRIERRIEKLVAHIQAKVELS